MWHQSKIYKFYEFFRYDIARFLKNVWRFRKPLANHYWWDHHAALQFLEIGLAHMAENLETKGLEVDESRLKKVTKIKRAVELIRNYNEDNYIDMAEAELGELPRRPLEFKEAEDHEGYFELVDNNTPEEAAHQKKVFARARELEELEWVELWSILKGQDHNEYREIFEKLSADERIQHERDHYYKWFDGSGMKGWWD